jgi:uncharacterized protein (DUF169 family)
MDSGRVAVPEEELMNDVVLIVEDEEQTVGILADYLRREGYVPFHPFPSSRLPPGSRR